MHPQTRAFLVSFALITGGARLRAQISPGPLARAHAALEGSTQCAECHGLRKEPMAQRCVACHKEIAWLMTQGRGLHAASRNTPSRTCASCHPDHAGADFALIDWGKRGSAQFDHARSGWTLEGKHARAKCTACHTAEFRTSPAAALSPRKRGAGWTGLETACASCHASDDVHRKSLGTSCERCHDAADWRKVPHFDHEKTKYPLTGKHADVACDKCHTPPRLRLRPNADGRVIGIYKPLPHAECSACHADPHKGRLTTGCSDCHSTRDFREVNRRGFDHAATRYPLLGRHTAVACERCHGTGLTRRTPAFAKCADCHADAHSGRAALSGAPVDCASCHRVEGFAPSTYTVARHQMARYPLAGRHAMVPCAQCHTATDSIVRAVPRTVMRRVELRPASVSCTSCHQDAHQGELANAATRSECTLCHDVRGWSPSAYTAAQHATLALPLTGAHAPLACARCHVPVRTAAMPTRGRPERNRVSLRLRPACDACHLDPHGGRYSAGGAKAPPEGCATCHDARRWMPAAMTTARHASFGLPLDGAHRAVPCRDCHKELGASPSRLTLRQPGARVSSLPFTGAPRTACAACHADPHAGQFTARAGACERCHDTAQWLGAARFVHDRDTSFPLAGAHSRVPCAACHARVAQSGGGTRVHYGPLPTACEGCHTNGVPRIRP